MPAGSRYLAVRRRTVADLPHCSSVFAGQFSVQRVVKGRTRDRIEALGSAHPGAAGRLSPRADLAPLVDDGSGIWNGWYGQTQRSPCLCNLVGTKRRTVRLFGALPVRRAKPMIVRHAISDGRFIFRACSIAAAIASGSCHRYGRADQPDALKFAPIGRQSRQ